MTFAFRYPAPIPCLSTSVRAPKRHLTCAPLGSFVGRDNPHERLESFEYGDPGSAIVARRQMALPSSRATPLDTCHGLRPRWCLQPSPLRVQDCCLPDRMNTVGFRSQSPASLSNDHHDTYFEAQYIACVLDPPGFGLPLPGLPSGFSTDRLAKLWSGGT